MSVSVLDQAKKRRAEAAVGAVSIIDVRRSVALALRGRGTELFTGVDGIENRWEQEVLDHPTDGTIFAAIGEELIELGIPGNYTTIGGVMQGLGYTGQEAYDKAHDIGCNCHGASITANDAATRVEELT